MGVQSPHSCLLHSLCLWSAADKMTSPWEKSPLAVRRASCTQVRSIGALWLPKLLADHLPRVGRFKSYPPTKGGGLGGFLWEKCRASPSPGQTQGLL